MLLKEIGGTPMSRSIVKCHLQYCWKSNLLPSWFFLCSCHDLLLLSMLLGSLTYKGMLAKRTMNDGLFF